MNDRVRVTDGFADPRYGRFLAQHYADPPLCDMPGLAVRQALRSWRNRKDVFFLVALIDDQIAGFILGQAVGSKPWRKLLARPLTLPFAVAALLRNLLAGPPLSGSSTTEEIRPDYPSFDTCAAGRREWSQGEAANVEFVFVDPQFRGHDIARQLLEEFARRVQQARIPVALAYIAPSNQPSLRAFTKAGWSIFRDGHTLRAVKELERK